ncbi:hypothetical protein SLEP1_g28690 [Rubroshorea leprosula]|uniref:Secreted protein n=1 Tax=Rubroshorea leprosula TaxID=152421 RepID=A0AAV5K5N9_9ROSI|nr:hypothetical protein SLEP1_g28690 [Rubroshorea leprosula]
MPSSLFHLSSFVLRLLTLADGASLSPIHFLTILTYRRHFISGFVLAFFYLLSSEPQDLVCYSQLFQDSNFNGVRKKNPDLERKNKGEERQRKNKKKKEEG